MQILSDSVIIHFEEKNNNIFQLSTKSENDDNFFSFFLRWMSLQHNLKPQQETKFSLQEIIHLFLFHLSSS